MPREDALGICSKTFMIPLGYKNYRIRFGVGYPSETMIAACLQVLNESGETLIYTDTRNGERKGNYIKPPKNLNTFTNPPIMAYAAANNAPLYIFEYEPEKYILICATNITDTGCRIAFSYIDKNFDCIAYANANQSYGYGTFTYKTPLPLN